MGAAPQNGSALAQEASVERRSYGKAEGQRLLAPDSCELVSAGCRTVRTADIPGRHASNTFGAATLRKLICAEVVVLEMTFVRIGGALICAEIETPVIESGSPGEFAAAGPALEALDVSEIENGRQGGVAGVVSGCQKRLAAGPVDEPRTCDCVKAASTALPTLLLGAGVAAEGAGARHSGPR